MSVCYISLKVILFASTLFSSFRNIGAMNWDCYFVLIIIQMKVDQSAAIVLKFKKWLVFAESLYPLSNL